MTTGTVPPRPTTRKRPDPDLIRRIAQRVVDDAIDRWAKRPDETFVQWVFRNG